MASEQKIKPPRPISTTSSQLSISDRMTDGDEEDGSMRLPTASSCSSMEVDQPLPPTEPPPPPPPKQQDQQNAPLPQTPSLVARTTTLSTIAMESNTSPPGSGSKCGSTRLVIALLQTPYRGLQLKVIELSPPLLRLPDNLPDAEDFLKNHNQVIKNLQSKQSPVEELLRQADNLIATQKPRAEVYAAMADSLGQTWKDLNGILEERRIVIELAFNAHKNITECLKKMDDVHSYYSRLSYFGGMDFERDESMGGAQEQLKKLKADRADILRRVATCLESCDQLLNKIAEYNYTIDSRELILHQDVEFAIRQVHRWLERLHDRRVILEERLRNKREQLEELLDNSKYDKEIREIIQELVQYHDFSNQFNFGDSVPSAEQRKEQLSQVEKQLKILQEKALNIVKRLENAEFQRAKFSQRFGLKNKIYEILSQTNDLLTEAMDLDLTVSDAIEFFRLCDVGREKLDSFSSTDPDEQAKTDLKNMIHDTLAKGEIILNAWDFPRTKGVRAAHDSLLQRKDGLLEELEHLAVLDEYNHFLECVNQTYQNILNIETSIIRQQIMIPVDNLESVHQFKTTQEKILEEVRRKLGLDLLTSNLQNIYPDLSEEEKCASEAKINEVKSLSNVIVQLLLNRVEIASEWGNILQCYNKVTLEQRTDRDIIASALQQIIHIYQDNMKPLLDDVHQSDRDLITSQMEMEIERIIRDLKERSDSFLVNERIREICDKYKAKLDHHLLGDGSSHQGPQYYPVLSRNELSQAIRDNKSKVSCLNHVIHKLIKPKLENTLTNFFQPLLTSYRQEILDIQQNHVNPKIQNESDLERYCDRLKESYVTVTAEIEEYLVKVFEICQQVEQRLESENKNTQKNRTIEELQHDLEQFDHFREEISNNIQNQIGPKFDHLLQTIRQEEPPREGEVEMESLRMMMAHLGHDQELDAAREEITRQMTDRVVQNDLNIISNQLQHLISELEQPTNYGNSRQDAKDNLENYEQFESTVQKLRQRLTELLTASAIPDDDQQADFVRKQLNTLEEKRKHRKDLILLSLDYFRLIDESQQHYASVNANLEGIRQETKDPEIQISRIEELLVLLRDIKGLEDVQEQRLKEIERISEILFEFSEPTEQQQHQPLRQRNTDMTGELLRLENDLTELLGFIRGRRESIAEVAEKPVVAPKPVTEDITVAEPAPVELITQGPSFLPHPPISCGVHGKPFTLQLQVLGDPLPTAQWYKNGQCIETSPEYIITFNNGRCQIQFDELLKGIDEGIYSCHASNRVGEVETHIELQVKGDSKKPSKQKPKFIRPLPINVMSRTGQPLKLQCEFDSATSCNILWFKDEKVLTTTNCSAEMNTVDNLAILSFKELYPADSGRYSVLIRNSNGEIQSATDVSVKGLLPPETSDSELNVSDFDIETITPVVKMQLKDGEAGVGESIKLDCVIVGQPEPEVIWYKNATPIKESPNHHLKFKGDRCSLIIKAVTPHDAGKYSVVAVNNGGSVTSVCQVVVHEVDPDPTEKEEIPQTERPSFKTTIQDQMITAGDRFEFFVELDDDCDPSTNITWFKNNKKIEPGNDIEFVDDGRKHRLIFNEVKLTDKGNYLAKAYNASGDAKCFACLIVKENLELQEASRQKQFVEETEQPRSIPFPILRSASVSKPAKFVVPFEGRMVDEGEYNVVLKCVLEANPPARLQWTKNNSVDPLLPSPNLVQNYNEKTGDVELLFKKISISDAGRYSCTATNDCGMATSICDVVVKKIAFPPVFSKRLQSMSLDEGKRLYLEVDVYGKPSPDVVWLLNGQVLYSGNTFEMRSDTPTRHSLIIANVVPSQHSGEYRIIAKNEAGEASSVCNIQVIKSMVGALTPPPIPPKPPTSPKPLFTVPTSSSLASVPAPRVMEIESSSTKFSSFENRTTLTTNVPAHISDLPSTSTILPLHDSESLLLEPGPEPELLVAPSPTHWKLNKNQVQEKVKTFEVRSETPDMIAPPSGGIRLLPVKEQPKPMPVSLPEETYKSVNLPIQPLTYSSMIPGSGEFGFPGLPTSVEQPQFYDSSSTSSKKFVSTEHGHVLTEQYQSSQVTFAKPSKFIPEKMRESDYESELDCDNIPLKWTPRASPMSPLYPTSPPPTTTSAFASCKPGLGTSSVTSSSLFSTEQTFMSYSSIPEKTKPQVPPKPSVLSSAVPSSGFYGSTGPERSRNTVKSWPPTEQRESIQDPRPSLGLLSPRPRDQKSGARSPTPSKDALEMERSWSRPIRFSSPTKFGPSPISSPPPISPMEYYHSPTPPRIAPKPKLFIQSSKPYAPVTSPVPPNYPPHSSYAGPTRSGSAEPLYYVSVVSTPRTTPIPPPFSPTPEPTMTEFKTFHDKKEFFEKTSSYEETASSSYQHHKTTSSSFVKQTKPLSTLLESSFLPPPGEAPEFLFAPPLRPKPSSSQASARPFGGTQGSGDASSSSSMRTEFSSASCTKSSFVTSSDSQGKYKKIHEIRVIPPTPPTVTTPAVESQALIPYIKPSKFTPKLDFASSLDSYHKSNGDPILPKWNPHDEKVTLTTWKRVSYDPPPSEWRKGAKPRRSSLTILVDERMQDLNQKFKNNINLMTQGLCYNKLDRKVVSQLEPSSNIVKANDGNSSTQNLSVEANPLIYFKYDFGYEFGIADPKSVVIRAASEPPENFKSSSSTTAAKKSYIVDETGLIHLPIIHEKSGK